MTELYGIRKSFEHPLFCVHDIGERGHVSLTVFRDDHKLLTKGHVVKKIPKIHELYRKNNEPEIYQAETDELFEYFHNGKWQKPNSAKQLFRVILGIAKEIYLSEEREREDTITEESVFPKPDHKEDNQPKMTQAEFDKLAFEQRDYLVKLFDGYCCTAPLKMLTTIEWCAPIAWEPFGFTRDGFDYVCKDDVVFYVRGVDLTDPKDFVIGNLRRVMAEYLYHQNIPTYEPDEADREDDALMLWAHMLNAYLQVEEIYSIYNVLVDEEQESPLRDEMLASFKFHYNEDMRARFNTLMGIGDDVAITEEVSFEF